MIYIDSIPILSEIIPAGFSCGKVPDRKGVYGIENQKEMLTRYVREQGWNLVSTYVDDGVSGTTFDRPGLNEMISDARKGKINLIVVKDLSRFGRDYIETGKYIDVIFPSLGCRFIALNDGVDTIHKDNEIIWLKICRKI